MNTMVKSIYMFSLHQLILVRIDVGDLRLHILQRLFCWFVSGVVVVVIVAAAAAVTYVSAAVALSSSCAAGFFVAASASAAVAAYNGLELQLHTFHSHVIKLRF